MKYFGGCDVGSTYAKCVILDENGKMVADATVRSKINPVQSAELALGEAISKVDGLNSADELAYLIGTGYGRNKVPFADENISEISCHAMGVHVTNPDVKAIIDIGGQDTKVIQLANGRVKRFQMNDKCAAGTGKFLEVMADRLGVTQAEMGDMARSGEAVSISSMCTVFAESEVISLIGKGEPRENIANGVVESVVGRVAALAASSLSSIGANDPCYLTGGLCENDYVIERLEANIKHPVITAPEARFAGAIGAALCVKG